MGGQISFSRSAFQQTLREGDAGGNLVAVHLFYRQRGITLYVALIVRGLCLGKNGRKAQQQDNGPTQHGIVINKLVHLTIIFFLPEIYTPRPRDPTVHLRPSRV